MFGYIAMSPNVCCYLTLSLQSELLLLVLWRVTCPCLSSWCSPHWRPWQGLYGSNLFVKKNWLVCGWDRSVGIPFVASVWCWFMPLAQFRAWVLLVCVHNFTKNPFGKCVCSVARVHLCAFPGTHLFGVPLLKLRAVEENIPKVILLQCLILLLMTLEWQLSCTVYTR